LLVRRVPGEFALYDKGNPARISTAIRILDAYFPVRTSART
jgi:hypothetical protein